MNNGGFEPNIGDRDTLTYQLACDLRHICARNAEWLDQVIPCYDGFPIEEKRQKINYSIAIVQMAGITFYLIRIRLA